MFGGPGGRDIMAVETRKPENTSRTLGRLAKRFGPWWPMLLFSLVCIIVSTWAQVTTPELTGQLVDCYLTPAAGSAFGNFPGITNQVSSSASNCWFAEGNSPTGLTQTLVKKVFNLGGFVGPKADGSNMDNAGRIAGLLRMVLILVFLFVISAILTGLTFFSMTWSGQHVLRSLRIEVFKHLHLLPMGFFAEHEAGDLMSRITNDAVAIEQAINFALVNVGGGSLLLGWIVYNMLTTNIPFALLSVAVAPIMLGATVYFSAQARRMYRKSRKSMGGVNAQLQENISAVREVQAFNRAEENIEQFGGRVTAGPKEFIARTIGEYRNLDEIRAVVLANSSAGKVYLRDIAKVEDAHEEVRVITRLGGNPCVKLSVFKQADANTVDVARGVQRRIRELRPALPSGIKLGMVENQADYVVAALNGVRNAAIEAALLVILIIYLFLGTWRHVLVMALALPTTLILNFGLMKLGGFSLNIFSLGGLV